MLTAYLILQSALWALYGFVLLANVPREPQDAKTWGLVSLVLVQIAAPLALLLR